MLLVNSPYVFHARTLINIVLTELDSFVPNDGIINKFDLPTADVHKKRVRLTVIFVTFRDILTSTENYGAVDDMLDAIKRRK